MKKRIISLLLSAVMLFSLLPTTAFARSNSVELSDHAKMLLQKAAEHTGETQKEAIKAVADYLADPTCYDDLFEEGFDETDEDAIRAANALIYVAFLKTAFGLNGFAAVQNAGFDGLKCTINELPPVAYELLDLFDAVAAEDYANVITLASQVGEDGFALYAKVFEEESREVTEDEFLTAFKTYVTDTSVSGDLFNNTKKASEQYAAYIAELCGVTDPKSVSKFKQYADDWAAAEGNRYMLNYYGNLLSEDEFAALQEGEKEDYINRTLTGACLSFFDSFLENHFTKHGEHFSLETAENSFVDIMRDRLDVAVAHKESMINLIDALQEPDEDEKYSYVYGYLGELIDALSSDQYDHDTKILYTDWDNLYLALQGEDVVTSAFEVTDSGSNREIKLLKDISCARLGIHDEALSVAGGKSIILDLNGHKLDRNLKAAETDGNVIAVGDGASLTVQSSSKGKTDINMDAEKEGAAAIAGEGDLAIAGKRKITLEAPKGISSTGDVTLSGNLSVTSSEIGIACDELTVENGGRLEINLNGGSAFGADTTVTIPSGYEVIGGRINADGTFSANNGATQIIIRKKVVLSDPTYSVTAPAADEHGAVTLDKKSASSGETVTITVSPDKGYTLETLTVKDAKGKEIELTRVNDTTYTFKMPGSKVTVEATFMEDNSMLNFFVDVPVSEYYYDAVLWAAENGITSGTDAVRFSPNMGTTRAQVVTFLWRAAGCPEAEHTAAVFKDVSPDAYYVKAVEWVLSKGITKGTSETAFSPDMICTRAHIAAFMARFAGVVDADCQTGFTDVSVNAYYASAVAWMLANGVTEGTTATTYSPDADCTRAQIVTFLYRWMVK
ncbi:MAG: S-layer homology domain-containing protein [Eubacteriales bacterium]|nr:S-layer homology domain-containing protein [Eubacteriales bacterium]